LETRGTTRDIRMDDVRSAVRAYLLNEFLPGENPQNLLDSTPLISGGILDSIGTLTMITYLEQTFGVQFQAHEVNSDNLNTVNDIVRLVRSKQA
jgi:acyl carrier protein